MARRVFFSFHYDRDIWRANVVRNHWVTRGYGETGVIDASLWEEAKKKGDIAIKRMINEGLANTTATVVLVGSETSERRWIKYEILRSLRRNNAIIAVRIDQIKDQDGHVCERGRNPLSDIWVEHDGRQARLSDLCSVYDWVADDGFNNLGRWVEKGIVEAKEIRPAGQIRPDGASPPDLLDWIKDGDNTDVRILGGRAKTPARRSGMNG